MNETAVERRKWTQSSLENAVRSIMANEMTRVAASKFYKIPIRTLKRYVLAQNTVKSKLGRKFCLSIEHERELCDRIKRAAELGQPITGKYLRLSIYEFCTEKKLKHQFSDVKKIASYGWLRKFMRRTPDISLRKSQDLNPARAQDIDHTVVLGHFENVHKILSDNDLFGKPERIFNLDEKSCCLNLHKNQEVLAGSASQKAIGGKHGESVTIVACVNANGYAIPPMILFKGKRHDPSLGNDLPSGSVVKMTQKGHMTSTVFCEWLEHFSKYKLPGRILLVLDGAKIHMSLDIVETAEKYDIVPYCLPSNTTRELKPLERAVFRSFECHWDAELSLFWQNNGEQMLKKQHFGRIFSPVWDRALTPSNIKYGFKATGLFPFNPTIISGGDLNPEESNVTSSVGQDPSSSQAGPSELVSNEDIDSDSKDETVL